MTRRGTWKARSCGGSLGEALSQIGPEHRDVLVLNVVERMDYRSIAATLNIPVGTVRSRLNRSRQAPPRRADPDTARRVPRLFSRVISQS